MEKTNLPAKLNEQAELIVPEEFGDELYGEDQISSTDVVIPRLVLFQSLSEQVTTGERKPNLFGFNQGQGKQFDGIETIIVRLQRARVRFQEGDFGGDPLCRSVDGIHPDMDYCEKIGHDPGVTECSECPYSKWVGKTPPECPEGKNLLMLCVDEENSLVPNSAHPFFFSVQKENLGAFKKQALPCWQHQPKELNDGSKNPLKFPFAHVFRMEVADGKHPKFKGKYKIVRFVRLRDASPEEFKHCAEDVYPILTTLAALRESLDHDLARNGEAIDVEAEDDAY